MKIGNMEISPFLIVIVIGAVYLLVPSVHTSVNNLIGGGQAAPTTTTTTTVVAPESCQVDTTLTLSTWDKWSKASEITNGHHRVFVNGIDRGYKAEDGSIEVSYGDEVEVIFGENSTSHYSEKKTQKVPCVETMTLSAGLAAYDGGPTITLFTETGETMSTSKVQAFTTDEIKTLDIWVKTSPKKALGNPAHPGKGNMMCIKSNLTTIRKVELSGAEKGYQPNNISSAGGYDIDCYYFPVQENGAKFEGSLIVETTATEPTVLDNMTLYLYDVDVDLDADTQAFINDIEDEDKNNLGQTEGADADLRATIYIS